MNRFDRALRELRRETPMAGIEGARASLITVSTPRRPARVLAVALAAGVVVLLPFALRTPAAAMTLQDVKAATERATRVHSRWYAMKGDVQGPLVIEQWRDGKRARNDFKEEAATRGEIQHAYDGKRAWSRFAEFRYVSVVSKDTYDQTAAEGVFFELFRSMQAHNENAKEVPVRKIKVNGKPMLEFTVDAFAYSEGRYKLAQRNIWVVDPDRKLPQEMRAYTKRGKEWTCTSRGLFDYPEAQIDEASFRLDPKPDEVLIDKDAEARELPTIWEKGLGSQTVNGQTLELRDVVLDRRGAMSVIWTGGGLFQKVTPVTVTDAKGRKWAGAPYLAYTRSPEKTISESRLTKIEGKPSRMAMMYGLHGVVAAPLEVRIPVIRPDGTAAGTATFHVSKVRRTDQLFDMPEKMGISERSTLPARAIQR